MNDYKGDEKNRKLMIPVAAIFMSVVALVGIGYAAVSTSVSNEDNDVGTSVLEIDLFKGTDKTKVTDYAFDAGSVPYSINTVTNDGGSGTAVSEKTYSLEANNEVVLSEENLCLGLVGDKNGGSYNVTVTVSQSPTSSCFGSFKLYVGTSDTEGTVVSSTGTVVSMPFTSDGTNSYVAIKLVGVTAALSGNYTESSLPETPTLDVKFTYTPIE